MVLVALNGVRYEDPAAILCPVRSVLSCCISFLFRVLGLGDPKMLSPDQCGQLRLVGLNLLRMATGVALAHSAGGGQVWKAASLRLLSAVKFCCAL